MLLPAVYPCCWMDFFLMLLRSQLPDVSCDQTVSHSFSLSAEKGRAYSALAFGAGALSQYGDAFR
ncbi:Uncharacterised protein [Escherichia coli]|uniref:Uncharacterized protein n=1 Tax=Escherichia coli TaxID=562 RepID=A0A377BB96_ECOLX|nr:Uncharacterised protein [Escherichia coli]